MNFNITTDSIAEIKSDLEIIIVIDKNLDHRFVADKTLLKKAGFAGGQDEVCHLVEKERLYVGATTLEGDSIRPAVA